MCTRSFCQYSQSSRASVRTFSLARSFVYGGFQNKVHLSSFRAAPSYIPRPDCRCLPKEGAVLDRTSRSDAPAPLSCPAWIYASFSLTSILTVTTGIVHFHLKSRERFEYCAACLGGKFGRFQRKGLSERFASHLKVFAPSSLSGRYSAQVFSIASSVFSHAAARVTEAKPNTFFI